MSLSSYHVLPSSSLHCQPLSVLESVFAQGLLVFLVGGGAGSVLGGELDCSKVCGLVLALGAASECVFGAAAFEALSLVAELLTVKCAKLQEGLRACVIGAGLGMIARVTAAVPARTRGRAGAGSCGGRVLRTTRIVGLGIGIGACEASV